MHDVLRVMSFIVVITTLLAHNLFFPNGAKKEVTAVARNVARHEMGNIAVAYAMVHVYPITEAT